MKLKKAIVIIEKAEKTSTRWEKALGGKLKNYDSDNIILCSSIKVAEKIFSEPRISLLKEIAKGKQQSIRQLSQAIKRDFKNVYNDVMFLADLGLITIVEHGAQKSMKPTPKYSSLELDLAA